ncbi:hypothetical protein DLB91_23300 [Salmonella enterica subsp. enterica serovar Oranienburg]|nr:hypothetical protein [Salmonella enterica subsp. enterica serovar Oranienburg]
MFASLRPVALTNRKMWSLWVIPYRSYTDHCKEWLHQQQAISVEGINMQRLIAINKLLIAISGYNNSSKLRKDKKDEMYREVYRLIEYVENINLDLSGIDDDKILHTLLEIQIQVRLMQIGECKDPFVLPTSVLSTYLLKMRTLVRNTIHHSITGTAINEEEKTPATG